MIVEISTPTTRTEKLHRMFRSDEKTQHRSEARELLELLENNRFMAHAYVSDVIHQGAILPVLHDPPSAKRNPHDTDKNRAGQVWGASISVVAGTL